MKRSLLFIALLCAVPAWATTDEEARNVVIPPDLILSPAGQAWSGRASADVYIPSQYKLIFGDTTTTDVYVQKTSANTITVTGNLTCTGGTCGSGGAGSFSSSGVGTGYQDVTETATPANPAAGNDRLYLNSATHALSCLTSGGASCAPSGLPASPPTTPNLPFIVGETPSGGVAGTAGWILTGQTTARKITGVNDTVLATDCGNLIDFQGAGALAETLPTATMLAVPLCVFRLSNHGTATITVTPTTWQASVNGAAPAVNFTLTANQDAFAYVDGAGGQWDVIRSNNSAASGGTPCTSTALSIQYNNAGAFGCVTNATSNGTTMEFLDAVKFSGSFPIGSAPSPSSAANKGWKFCIYTTIFCTGLAGSTEYHVLNYAGTGAWLSVGNNTPSDNATNTVPDTAANASLGGSGILDLKEVAAPTLTGAGRDSCYADSTAHAIKCSYNNATALAQTQTVASGTATMTTAAITAGNCGTTVTVSATGTATTDTITWAFNAAPGGTDAGLVAWPTANNVNFAYCGIAETPAAATINWRVVR